MVKLADFLEKHLLTCQYKRFFGIECPWCGMQRSFVLLLRGEFIESAQTFPALIPMLTMLVFLVFHLIFKPKNGHKVLLVLFYITLSIILLHFIFRLITKP